MGPQTDLMADVRSTPGQRHAAAARTARPGLAGGALAHRQQQPAVAAIEGQHADPPGGRRYCPHYLGAGIGLMASAHVLAAAGGDGLLEIDANDNALRSLLAPPLGQVVDGYISLGEKPGLGVTPDIEALQRVCAALSADA